MKMFSGGGGRGNWGSRNGAFLKEVAIIYLALPPLTCPRLSRLSEKRVVQRKDEDMGRRRSETGLSPGESCPS